MGPIDFLEVSVMNYRYTLPTDPNSAVLLLSIVFRPTGEKLRFCRTGDFSTCEKVFYYRWEFSWKVLIEVPDAF
jgi:hypothetical protein